VPGPTWSEATTFPAIISAKQASRIDGMVRQTIAEGAEIRLGGGPLETQNAGSFYAPTILEGVTTEMTGFREEFFGPVLTVQRFDDLEEGLAMADHPIYGLAASVHTSNLNLALKAADGIEAGMVFVNQHGRGPEFTYTAGGFKASGFGKDMGRAGIEDFCRQKAVWVNYG
jgi:aldehyde dehydrogenase (NAD+)